ncbi:hypothetical protein [Neorhizobium sp. JUb45]|uniref:hypothetical protein n=1 Tax=Neorhizobium sp. JUb45 TaxID=2485113 RepID=UPI00104C3E7B|nr:hypothetical protein [Neorhizobium sp. JUb45]TCR04079.1 hypothetical protein EDF70_102176 [Neorhizobium sp. JUb45]
MSKVSEAEEKTSFLQLFEFREYWRHSSEYPERNYGNDVVEYPVIVRYSCVDPKRDRTFTTDFRAYVGSGPHDGVIDLDEAAGVSIDYYHLRFNPAFQRYTFDGSSGALIVTGSSSKMGGDYKVSITPAIERPSS